MKVLSPGPARREILRALEHLYRVYNGASHATSSPVFSQDVMPLAARLADDVGRGMYLDVTHAMFSPTQWAQATFELLHAYKAADGDEARTAVVHGNRLVWLLGALAFMHVCTSNCCTAASSV